MEEAELRALVAEILAEEELPDPDWDRVEALCAALDERLMSEPDLRCPDLINHFVDDPDIRRRDPDYAAWQRSRARRYADTGEMAAHAESVALPWWGCLLIVAMPAAALLWWLL
jgi:hypothetical protein